MDWRAALPPVQGRLVLDAPLAPYTWLRVGGPAQVLFLPRDEADLSAFLAALDPAVAVTMLGVGSNVLVRDGGVDGVVIRLGRGFANVETCPGARVRAGAGALDAQVAKAAAQSGIAGLEFFTGVPGSIGGACTMNAGCYGAETRDVLVEASGLDRQGRRLVLSNAEMGFAYRRSAAAAERGLVFIEAMFQGRPDDPAVISARTNEVTARREASQPIRERTGGSTFKNPPGQSAWELVDRAGWRGKAQGAAMFSPQHANFLINTGEAAAADLEGLVEAVRADVRARFQVELEWEIRRLGRATRSPAPGAATLPASGNCS